MNHFGSYTISKPSSCCIIGVTFSPFFFFLLVILMFKMVPKHSVEMLSSVSKCGKAMMSLLEKICVLDKLLSSMNYSAGVSLI